MADFRSIIGKTLAQYRIDKLLGHGGMAAVYQATDLQQERLVALKIMHSHLAAQKSFQDRFMQEASAISRLSHPNIVRIFGFDRAGGELFIVMELVTGGTLRSYVKKLSEEARYMPLLEAVDIGRQLASALNYAHSQGMMHRDVKPDNVVLRNVPVSASSTGYQPVLTDFGLARLVDDNEHTDQPLGTYPYMSPEQCLGERVDTRTDIYSLGIVLYELTAGRLPFVPRTIGEAARMHSQEVIVKPSAYRPDIPGELDTIILKALAKDPAQRYQTGESLAEDLERVMRQLASRPVDEPDRDMATDAFATEKYSETLSEDRPDYTPPQRERRDEGKDRLVAYSAHHPPVIVILKQGVNSIGTADDQAVRLQGPFVSRRHARLEVMPDDTFRVTDLGSTNGTWVSSLQINSGRSMKMIADDTLRIGDYWVWVDRDAVSPVDIATDMGIEAGPAVIPVPVPLPIPMSGESEIEKTLPPEEAAPEPVVSEPDAPEPVVASVQTVENIEKTPVPPESEASESAGIDKIPSSEPPVLIPMTGPFADNVEKTPPPPPESSESEPQPPHEPATLLGMAAIPRPSKPVEQSAPPVEEAPPAPPAPTPQAEQTIRPNLPPAPPTQPEPPAPPPQRLDSGPTYVMPAIPLPSARPPAPPPAQTQPPAAPLQIEREAPAPPPPVPSVPTGPESEQTVKPGSGLAAREAAIAARRERMRSQREASSDMDAQKPPARPTAPADDMSEVDKTIMPDDVGMTKPGIPAAKTPEPPARPADSGVRPPGTAGFGRGTGGLGRNAAQTGGTSRSSATGAPATPGGTGAARPRRPANDDGGIDKTIMPVDEVVGSSAPLPAIPEAPVSAAPQKSGPSIPNLVGQRLGAYRLTKLVGQGTQSSVYEAWDTKANRPIALKVLHPNLAVQDPLRRRFIDEARVLSSLEHPNIVKVYTFETADGYVFMVMELISGGNIRGYMRKMRAAERAIGFQDVMSMGRMIADALHYAHQQGLLHRDIKPDNIVLRDSIEESEAKKKPITPVLTDFGLAKASEQGEGFATDQQGVAFQYLSPEEAQGLRADARSDIYELGTLMYELVTGQTPFQPQSMAEAIRMYSREAITRPSDLRIDVPLDLERIISRALERDPSNRYQTAAELSRALQTVITSYKAPSQVIEEIQAPSEEDLQDTVIMEAPLPEAAPLYTPQPVTDEQVGFERLIIMSNNFPLRVIPMNKNLITIGRSEDQTVRLEGKTISRRHARIERGFGSQFRIIDVGSINGTYVGGAKLTSNVAEILTPDKIVRLGEYWIKLEPAAMRRTEARPRSAPSGGIPSSGTGIQLQPRFVQTITNLDDGDAAASEAEQYQVVRTGVKKIELPAPEHDKVGFKVINPIVTVAPGSSMTMTMEVQNLHNLVDHFIVQLEGLPLSWYTIQQAPIYLLPNNRETASITFHPPLDSKSSEGGHYFEVRVVTRAQGIKSVAVQCLLTILPFKNFVTALEPRRATERVRPELMIRNTGNTFAIYTIQARDREQGIIYELPGKQYSIAPGQEEYMSMRLRARSRPFIGSERSIPFEVIVTADDDRLPPQTLTGDMVIRPRFPVWLIGLLPLLCILCLALALLFGYGGYSLYNTNINNTATTVANELTATLVAQATAVPVTATAIAESDPDGDGLSNIREKEIGSDPNKADTDEDGLNDGAEVNIWNTIPMNRDTDGDGWTDGEEVNVRGTNPLIADTDGDSIPDPVDTEPLVQPTATITPFPTLVGSIGDICAGSPPARMQVGMDGVVEPGGVPNHVRDNPGVIQGASIGKMPPGTAFRVLEGPECDPDEQLRWWKVDSANGFQGWTAEGRGDEYYIAPQGEEGDGSAAGSGGAGAAAGGGGGGGAAGGGGTNTEVVTTNPDVKALSDDIIASLGEPDPNAFDRTRMGIQLYQNNDVTAWNAALDRVGQIKMGWIKVQVNWATLQPDGPGSLGGIIEIFEQDIAAAKSRGARVMISVAKAPGWARGGNSEGSGPPDDPQTLADFLTLLLARVGSNVDAIEIWNEPNLRTEWNLASLSFDGNGYMQLFRPAYTAIRAFSPSITIITAGLAPTYTSERSVDDRTYLRQMYAAGLNSFLDIVIGVHPYGWGNDPILRCCDAVDGRGWDDNTRFFFLQTLEEYRSIQLENTHDVKIWITEFGWPTWDSLLGDPPEPWMGYNTPVEQSNYTLRAFQLGQRLPYVGPMMLWNLNFGTTNAIAARSPFAAYSLILDNGVMRPTFGSLLPTS